MNGEGSHFKMSKRRYRQMLRALHSRTAADTKLPVVYVRHWLSDQWYPTILLSRTQTDTGTVRVLDVDPGQQSYISSAASAVAEGITLAPLWGGSKPGAWSEWPGLSSTEVAVRDVRLSRKRPEILQTTLCEIDNYFTSPAPHDGSRLGEALRGLREIKMPRGTSLTESNEKGERVLARRRSLPPPAGTTELNLPAENSLQRARRTLSFGL